MAEQVIDMFVGPKALNPAQGLIEAAQYLAQFDEMVQNIVLARFGGARTIIQAPWTAGSSPPGRHPT